MFVITTPTESSGPICLISELLETKNKKLDNFGIITRLIFEKVKNNISGKPSFKEK